MFVCSKCFEDDGIQNFILANAGRTLCDFCGGVSPTDPIAAPFDDVVSFIGSRIEVEFDLAANCLGYSSADGGYLGEHWDTDDLLYEIELELPLDEHGLLRRHLIEALGVEIWCRRDPYSLREDEMLVHSWQQFCQLIKHKSRFFFINSDRPDSISEALGPAQTLDRIGRACEAFGLVDRLPEGATLFRVHKNEPGRQFETSRDFGPPPRERATMSQRMSPPGIPMLYSATDRDTALVETADGPGHYLIATLRLCRPTVVIDLTRLPSVPSLFAVAEEQNRFELMFLHWFAHDVSRPIERDDRVHVEYVPTQVVTEYFRSQFQLSGGQVDGLLYRSARRPEGKNVVLFAEPASVVLASIATGAPLPDRGWRRDPAPWIEVVGQPEAVHLD